MEDSMTSRSKALLGIGLLCLLCLTLPSNARADEWNFSYSAPNISGVGTDVAIGELFTTALSGGQATITGIAGTYNGLTITGLLAPGACCEGPAFANDNILFFPGAPGFLDIFGLGFQVEGVTDVNLFLFVGYEDEAAPAGNTAAFAVISDQGTF